MIASDLAAALDPVAFAERALDFRPDGWQARVLRSPSPRMLLNCSRQSGKSVTAAALAIWTALYQPGALCLMLSPTLRQSGELFRKAKDLYGALPGAGKPPEETALSLRLGNGSRVISLPGTEGTVRGYSSVALLCIDEASRVDDSLYYAVRPMLATSGGRLLALSTPWGGRGWWHHEWTKGGPSWHRVEVPATDCPRIPAAFLEEERRTMGEWWYRQEYGCEFLDAQTQAFGRADVDRAFEEEVTPWDL